MPPFHTPKRPNCLASLAPPTRGWHRGSGDAASLPACLPAHLSVYLNACLSNCLPACLPDYLCLCLYLSCVCVCICPAVRFAPARDARSSTCANMHRKWRYMLCTWIESMMHMLALHSATPRHRDARRSNFASVHAIRCPIVFRGSIHPSVDLSTCSSASP